MIIDDILVLLAVVREVEGGIQAFVPIIAAMFNAGLLTQEQMDAIEADAAESYAGYKAAIAAAKARLESTTKENP